jgi:hypothetical protein
MSVVDLGMQPVNPLMNDTKGDEFRLGMYGLGDLSPRWRTKDVSGYESDWGEWFYHFRAEGYTTIEWVEISVTSPEQDAAVLELLRKVHVPGHRVEQGFRVYGYVGDQIVTDFI